MSRIKVGQKPKTKFIDEENSIIVKLIQWPDKKQSEKMLVNFAYGYKYADAYSKLSAKERKQAIKNLITEGTLPKGLEALGNFVFSIENISLTVSHCVVRHRFFTIIQSSTAVEDLRDETFLMPRSFARDELFYEKIKNWYLEGKSLYCEAVDSKGLSVQNARLLIPKNNCNHMLVAANLMAIKNAYAQRVCTCEEPIQNNIIFNKMRELIIDKFPYLDSYFKSGCETGQCLHTKTGKAANIVFKRDKLHTKFIKGKYSDNTLHDQTRDEMNKGPVIQDEEY